MKYALLVIALMFSYQLKAISINERIKQPVDIDKDIYFLEDNNYSVYDVKDREWQLNEKGGNFGIIDKAVWLKIPLTNNSEQEVRGYLYTPYYHINFIDVYVAKKGGDLVKLNALGSKRTIQNKPLPSRGYPIALKLPKGTTTVYMKLSNRRLPLRARVFWVPSKSMLDLIQKDSSTLWFWRGFFWFAIILSFSLYVATKLRVFLYYALLNIGVALFIGAEVGDLLLFYDFDPAYLAIDVKHIGNLITIFFFPLFLNQITPIKQINTFLWKLTYWGIYGACLLVTLCLMPMVKDSVVLLITTHYLILWTSILFLIQLWLLFKATIQRKRNALMLFIVYFTYIGAVMANVILPASGITLDSIHVYNTLLWSSIIEIFSFLLVMGKETLAIYRERETLLQKQGLYQKQILKAIVQSQEEERNRIGGELHDMIGGNMSILKHQMQHEKTSTLELLDTTIESVRDLSHGLLTPRVEGRDFEYEIKDICNLASNDKMKIEARFYSWKTLAKQDFSKHVFRICQELIQNAIKHSKATQVDFQFLQDETSVQLSYEDNGVGFDLEEAGEGRGILGIKHRVELLNGEISIASRKSEGMYCLIKFRNS